MFTRIHRSVVVRSVVLALALLLAGVIGGGLAYRAGAQSCYNPAGATVLIQSALSDSPVFGVGLLVWAGVLLAIGFGLGRRSGQSGAQ